VIIVKVSAPPTFVVPEKGQLSAPSVKEAIRNVSGAGMGLPSLEPHVPSIMKGLVIWRR
jgi:hypothetical protein